jgi:2-amino-4-hydroxy-6-hydroxymethyldihydropteridine diphosphokinase
MTQVILGLGSNKGKPEEIIKNAINDLKEFLADTKAASLYRTTPVGVAAQPDFLNTALRGNFLGTEKELLTKIHIIEKKYGRDRAREIRWGQRSLDIDILLFGNLILNEVTGNRDECLEIPHPRLNGRRFALEPLLELAPFAKDPRSGEYYHIICARLPDQGVRRL